MGTTITMQRDKVDRRWLHSGEGDLYPMQYISWDEASDFCDRLNAIEKRRYRLPTEAEWEYACRAGTKGPYGGTERLDDMGWAFDILTGEAHPVGQKKPNAWGLYDMHGNVWEWCQDWYGKYPTHEIADYKGPKTGAKRVARGGSWDCLSANCRSAIRLHIAPETRSSFIGFRVAMDVPPD